MQFLIYIGAIWGTLCLIGAILWVVFGKGKKEALGEVAQKTVSDVAKTKAADDNVTRLDDAAVRKQLLDDWTK